MNIYIQTIKEISFDNKYTKLYIDIISNSLKRASTKKEAANIIGYCEKHHIVPKSFYNSKKSKFLIGESENIQNFSYLTAREHFIVHMLLPKMIIDDYFSHNISSALNRMRNGKSKYNNSRSFETARKIWIRLHNSKSEESRKKTSEKMKAFYSSEEGKKFMKEKSDQQKITMIGIGNPAFGKTSGFAGKSHSESHIKKLKNNIGNNNHKTGVPAFSKEFDIIHKNGKIERIRNLKKYCLDNNISHSSAVWNIDKTPSVGGINDFGILIKSVQDKPKAILISPDNIKHEIYNIKSFCMENNLYYQCIIHVICGKKPQHKGWTGYKINRN